MSKQKYSAIYIKLISKEGDKNDYILTIGTTSDDFYYFIFVSLLNVKTPPEVISQVKNETPQIYILVWK